MQLIIEIRLEVLSVSVLVLVCLLLASVVCMQRGGIAVVPLMHPKVLVVLSARLVCPLFGGMLSSLPVWYAGAGREAVSSGILNMIL